jgi:hypothetical protein
MDTTEETKKSEGVLAIRWMLISLCVFAFIYGLRFALYGHPSGVDLLLVWTMDILTILICARDARQRGTVLLNSYRWIMFFTWPLSIWFYFIICRGFKGLGVVLLWSLILTASYVVGGVLVLLISGN